MARHELSSPPSGDQLARTLLSAKVTPPLVRDNVIARERLLHLLERAPRPKLVLLHAPAGYGKTTLMVQWLRQLRSAGEGVGWINLDELDNDAVNLLAGLQLALLPDSGSEVLDALSAISRCASRHRRFTLFLDELEAVQTQRA